MAVYNCIRLMWRFPTHQNGVLDGGLVGVWLPQLDWVAYQSLLTPELPAAQKDFRFHDTHPCLLGMPLGLKGQVSPPNWVAFSLSG
jgi:hypothetical protein